MTVKKLSEILKYYDPNAEILLYIEDMDYRNLKEQIDNGVVLGCASCDMRGAYTDSEGHMVLILANPNFTPNIPL